MPKAQGWSPQREKKQRLNGTRASRLQGRSLLTAAPPAPIRGGSPDTPFPCKAKPLLFIAQSQRPDWPMRAATPT